MADRFIGNTTEVFQLGQTVFAKVTNLDEEKRRFLVTLKITEVMSPESEPQTRLINGLNERKAAAEMLAARGASTRGVILKQPNDLKHSLRPAYNDSLAQLWSARRKFGNMRSNVQLSRP